LLMEFSGVATYSLWSGGAGSMPAPALMRLMRFVAGGSVLPRVLAEDAFPGWKMGESKWLAVAFCLLASGILQVLASF